MPETSRKPFKRKLKRDELIAMANDSHGSDDEKDDKNFEARESQNDDKKTVSTFVAYCLPFLLNLKVCFTVNKYMFGVLLPLFEITLLVLQSSRSFVERVNENDSSEDLYEKENASKEIVTDAQFFGKIKRKNYKAQNDNEDISN